MANFKIHESFLPQKFPTKPSIAWLVYDDNSCNARYDSEFMDI